MKTKRVIEATRLATENTRLETISVALKPGNIVVYGAPATVEALELCLARLGLKLTLVHRSICG